ncbi:hypothetical protein ACFXJJ_18895, partial [Streptomyces sp. NPDC059233]
LLTEILGDLPEPAAGGNAAGEAPGATETDPVVVVGMEAAELERRLRRSGLAHRPPYVQEQPRDRPWFAGEIALGGAFVTVRRQRCPVGGDRLRARGVA